MSPRARRKLTPRPALSAREVDRVQREVTAAYIATAHVYCVSTRACPLCPIRRRLTRVLGMLLARSERR